MHFLQLKTSPHAPGISPIRIHYRDIGSGPVVVFLHGGWGYGAYPIDYQIEAHQLKALGSAVRFIIPDRTGHGRSTLFSGPLPLDFHRRAAEETLLVLDKLKIPRAIFWGHSDGAVIAALIGLQAPERCRRLILEAFHLYRDKPSSRAVFFQKFARHPEEVSERMRKRLLEDHGARHWKNVVQRNCKVWLDLADASTNPDEDLYDGRLGKLKVPVTLLHGRGDPRTEPGEVERAHQQIAPSELHFIETGRHSPHSEKASWEKFTAILHELIKKK